METPAVAAEPVGPGATATLGEAGGIARDYLSTLRRRVWVIIEVTIIGVVGAGLLAVTQTPIYESTLLLLLPQERPTTPMRREAIPLPEEPATFSSYAVQTRIIESRLMAGLVVARVAQEDSGYHEKAVAAARQMVQTGAREEAEESLARRVRATPLPKIAGLATVSVQDPDPYLAYAFADAYGQAYEQYILQQTTQQTSEAVKFLKAERAKIEQDLVGLEEEIEEFKKSVGSPLDDVGATQKVERLTATEARRHSNDALLANVRARLGEARGQLELQSPYELSSQPVQNPNVERLEAALQELQAQRLAALQEYTELSPEVEALDQEMALLRQQLRQEPLHEGHPVQTDNPVYRQLSAEVVSLAEQIRSVEAENTELSAQIASFYRDLAQIPEQQTRISRLLQKAEVLRELRSTLYQRQIEMEMEQRTKLTPVRIIERAAVPTSPIKPNRLLITLGGLVGGVLLGLLLAGVIDQLDDTFASNDEMERVLNVPVVATVPLIREMTLGELFEADPQSLFAEAIRAVASNVSFLTGDGKPQMLVVTSTIEQEGKSTIAANLAVAIANTGKQVLLVDSDLRRPMLADFFPGLDSGPGLTNVLAGTATLQEAIVATGLPNVRLVPAGPVPPDPAALLSSDGARRLWAEARRLADIVIVDTPPAALVPDPALVGASSDGVVFVLDPKTKRQATVQAANAMRRANARVVGIVRNKSRERGAYQYYYYYHHYYQPSERRRARGGGQPPRSGPGSAPRA